MSTQGKSARSLRVCVVIPYFQRKPGILAGALRSILAQEDAGEVTVIIVDDESPVSPDGEIPVDAPDGVRFLVVRQPNGGPAKARNTGLDHVPPETDVLAFLDSDDTWTPTHLHNASEAVVAGYDFYFANYTEPGTDIDAFAEHRRLESKMCKPLPFGSHLFEYQDDMVAQLFGANVIETSTVVYRWSRFSNLRFDRRFEVAFEDHYFWFSIVNSGCRIAFSTVVESRYGLGVNIWRSSRGMESDLFLRGLVDQRRLYSTTRLHWRGNSKRKMFVSDKVRLVRSAVVASVLFRVRRRIKLQWRSLSEYAKADPLIVILALPIALKVFRSFVNSRVS